MTRSRRVLFICVTFPPHVGGSLARNVQFARHLLDHGWTPTVLTTRAGSGPFQDALPLHDLPREVRVVRAWSPRYPGAAATAEAAGRPWSAAVQLALRRAVRAAMLRSILIPDSEILWVPFAVRTARRLLAEDEYDAILSGGPPYSAHVVARMVRRSRKIRWVADCTDPWSGNPYWRYGRIRDALDRWLERRVLGAADAIVTPSPTLTERFRTLLGSGARFATIPNGYDESEFERAAPIPRGDPHLVHIGSLYGRRSPDTFLAAIEQLIGSSPALGDRLRVTFSGYADPRARASISSSQRRLPTDVLRYEPFSERRTAIGLMLGADALVLITDSTAAGRELIPLKTYEYLRAGRPILALVPPGELRSLLQRTGGAILASPDDPAEVAQALRTLLADHASIPPPAPAVVAAYEAKRLTRCLAELLSTTAPGEDGRT